MEWPTTIASRGAGAPPAAAVVVVVVAAAAAARRGARRPSAPPQHGEERVHAPLESAAGPDDHRVLGVVRVGATPPALPRASAAVVGRVVVVGHVAHAPTGRRARGRVAAARGRRRSARDEDAELGRDLVARARDGAPPTATPTQSIDVTCP